MEIENPVYEEEISNKDLPKVFNNCTFKNCKFRFTIYVKAEEKRASNNEENVPRFLDNEEEWQTQEDFTVEQSETPAPDTPEAPQEKKRGRPKGSKNKKKSSGNVKI